MKLDWGAWASRWRVSLGFVFAALYFIWSRPTPRLVIVGGIISFLGLALRAVAAGYIEKGKSLSTAGPYAFTRNPLYLGSFLLGLGFMIAGGNWILAALFCAFFGLIYVPVMRREEGFLRRKFDFEAYANAVPFFFPVPGRRFRGRGAFSWRTYRNNREYNAAVGYTALLLFLIVKLMLG